MPTLTPEEIIALAWQEAQDNIERINSCKKHYFPFVDAVIGARSTCSKCGGMLNVLEVRQYVLGYIAAGGDHEDILKGW